MLLALVVLAIGGVTLLELQLFSMRAADRAARQSQAVLLASQKMAEALASTSIAPGANQGVTDEDTPGGPLNWTVTVADLSSADIQGASTTGLCSVTVDVTWPEGDARAESRVDQLRRRRRPAMRRSPNDSPLTAKTRKGKYNLMTGIRHSAFTLIEILVALAIMVIVVGCAYGIYFAATKSAARYRARTEVERDARALLRMMGREIRCSYFPSPNEAPTVQSSPAGTSGSTSPPGPAPTRENTPGGR